MNPQAPFQPLPPQPGQPPVAPQQPQFAATPQPQVINPAMPPQPVAAQPGAFAPQPQPIFQPQPIQPAMGGYQQPLQSAYPVASAPHKSSKKIIFIVLAAVLIPVILGIGLLTVLGIAASKNSIPTYKQYTTYTNTKADKGSGYSIEHPTQFSVDDEYASSTSLSHKIDTANKKDSVLGTKYARLSIDKTFVGTRSMKVINEQFDDTNSEVRKTFDEDAKKQFNTEKNVVIGQLKTLPAKNGNKAYAIDYSYDQDDNVHVIGKVMFTFGKEEIYTVDTSAVDKVWNKNPATWDRMLDSFKFDL